MVCCIYIKWFFMMAHPSNIYQPKLPSPAKTTYKHKVEMGRNQFAFNTTNVIVLFGWHLRQISRVCFLGDGQFGSIFSPRQCPVL